MFQIGVVGSVSSVKRIIEMAGSMQEEITFNPFPYTNFQETRTIVHQHEAHIDVWFFSGELPFLIAKEVLGTDEHIVYVENTEASLYRCFLQMFHNKGELVRSLSMDDTSDEIKNSAMEQLDWQPTNIYLKTYDVDTNPAELYEYHLTLWNEGNIDGVITSFEKVYNELKACGIPAYWFTISNIEIQHSFRILKEKVRTFYFKDMQIGIVIIDIAGFHHIIQQAKSPYHVQYLELRLKESLIQLCESVDGSLMEKGNGSYIIYSSRGALERGIKMIYQTADQLKLESETTVSIGIGYGETAFSAELNALQAIEQSKERKDPAIVMLQEDGKVVEAAGQREALTYSSQVKDPETLEKLKKANVSLRTFNRLIAFLVKVDKYSFTTKDFVTHLQMEERNARRIVANLNKADLIEVVGEQALSTRGRPSKVYRIVT